MSPIGPPQEYYVAYNGYQLPGYAQTDDDSSNMNIVSKYAPYVDGGLSEYTGLTNKSISMSFKIWEADWATCKEQYLLAETYLRSKRSGWADLHIGDTYRHYNAMTKSVKRSSRAGSSNRLLEYDVDWEVQPWLERNVQWTVSGTTSGVINTDAISRTISTHGGWSPVTARITGTNITISGYTDTEPFTGYMSISGAVSNLVVDTEEYTAKIGSTNKNDVMLWKDYQLWVAPGKTYFNIGGTVTLVRIQWYDRWY